MEAIKENERRQQIRDQQRTPTEMSSFVAQEIKVSQSEGEVRDDQYPVNKAQSYRGVASGRENMVLDEENLNKFMEEEGGNTQNSYYNMQDLLKACKELGSDSFSTMSG
jgi:hypothetical protein